MVRTEINPYRRNISVTEQINELGEKRAKFVQLRQEKQLELDVINSDISSIEAQIANILMRKRSRKK
ncbi:MAG: hypothetical protein IJ305_02165 [Oscillospiraceae bacterium]|nr:hypothetical protein [Ruminococcus sp.]MBQ7793683.1 hypothetical protein [Clostridia bacterium]MBQ7980392.1 hypothetical protein [Oscillospiraceae bacterium]